MSTVYDVDGNFVWSRRLTDSLGNYGFAVLPDGSLACISNRHDVIYVFDADGDTLAAPAMPNPAEGDFMTAAVVAGDRLVVANNGNGDVVAVDLSTYEASILYAVPQGGPLASQIEYLDGRFFSHRLRMHLRLEMDCPESRRVTKQKRLRDGTAPVREPNGTSLGQIINPAQ